MVDELGSSASTAEGEFIMSTSRVLAVVLAALALSAGSAAAQSGVAAGVLECRSGPSASFIVGSVRNFECVFTPNVGRRQFYWGRVTRVGVDLGFSNETALVWTVFAPAQIVGP